MVSVLLPLLAAVLALHGASAALDPTDLAVLNFALNLEYLGKLVCGRWECCNHERHSRCPRDHPAEANFYSCAAYGMPINETFWGAGGVAPLGCEVAKLSDQYYQVADEIAQDELAHVRLLRSVLGDQAVDQPLIDIGSAFRVAGDAAIQLATNSSFTHLVPPFSPYSSDITFLHGAFIFEDVGATAYAGAAALIVDKGYLTAAAQILAVEAYHAGAIRGLLAVKLANARVPFSAPPDLRVRDVIQAISDLRDAVDGPSDDDQGIVVEMGRRRWRSNIVPTDSNGLIYTRSTDQVLRIVYLGGASKGGFFPNGLNGAITTAQAV